MTFNAYKAARDSAKAVMESADIAAVAAEFGIKVKPIRRVFRHSRIQRHEYPCGIVGQPRGDTDDQSRSSIKSDITLTIMAACYGADPDEMDAAIEVYLTAYVRAFSGIEHGGFEWSVAGFDADQPSQIEDGDLVQTCAVLLRAVVVE